MNRSMIVKTLLKTGALLIALAGLSMGGNYAYAVTCTSIGGGGNWNNPGTWTGCAGGNGPVPNTPGSNDTAIIATTGINVVTANVAITVGSLIINSGKLNVGGSNWTVNGTTTVNSTGTIDQTATAGNAIFVGLVTINNGGTWANTNGENITFRGGITNNGTFNGGAGTMTFATNSQVLGGGSPINFGGAVTVNNGLTVTNNNTSIVTITGTLNGANAVSTWVNGANSTLNYNSATAPMATGVLTATASGNTVNYTRAGAQTADGTTYYNLTLSGSGIKTIAGVTVDNILNMAGTATASAAPTYGAAATLQYDTTHTTGPEWLNTTVATGGVIINGGTVTLAAAKVMNPSIPLTVNTGASLALGTNLLTLGGDLIVNGTGTVSGTTGGVTINGSATQNIGPFTTTGTVLMSKTGGTATLTGNVGGGALTINGAGGTLNLGTGLTHTFSGAWTRTAGTLNGGSSTLNIGGSCSGTGGTFTADTSTVDWNANGAQTVCAVSYHNLTLSNSGAKTLTGVTTVGGNLTLSGTATATTAANFSIGVNLTVGAGTTFTSANFTNLVSGTTSVSGTLAHSGVAAKTYVGTVTINSGGAWTNAGNAPVTFRGGITQNAVTANFSAGTGVHTFDTTAAQALNCVGGTTLSIPSLTVTSPTVLTNNCTLTVSTALAGTGNLTNAAAGTLNIGGTSGIATLTATAVGNVVNYTGTGQTVKATSYDTLNITGTATNGGTVTVAAALGGAGTLTNAAAGTLNIGGTSGITTLTATVVGNTVNYTGAAQTVKATAYYDLGLSGSGAKTMTGVTTIGGSLSVSGSATMTGNAAFTATGALNYSSTGSTTLTAATAISIGSYNQSAGTLIDNGNTITVTGTGANIWSQSGGTFSPTGTVTFVGAAPQIGTANFNNLTINVGVGNSATLTGNVTAGNVLTLISGLVTTGSNVLEVTSNCTTATSGASANSHLVGNLRLHYPTNAGTTTCTFPIGSAAAYSPATVAMVGVTSSLANSTLTARTDAGDHPNTTANTAGINPARSVNRYWTLTGGGSLAFSTYNVTFTFVAGDIDGGANTANFVISRKSGGVWSYPTIGARNPTNTSATGITQANGFGEFVIGERAFPSLTMLKAATVYSDPYNNTTNAKAIPGAILSYTIRLTNSGFGTVDANTVIITDNLPSNLDLFVGNIGGSGSGPIAFTDGSPVSGLSWTFTSLASVADSVDFSQDGSNWAYTPVPDLNGFDSTVRHIRLKPSGTMNGAGGGNPYFDLLFRVRIH
jgi:hypothetical protein